jgi:hypothetical protein
VDRKTFAAFFSAAGFASATHLGDMSPFLSAKYGTCWTAGFPDVLYGLENSKKRRRRRSKDKEVYGYGAIQKQMKKQMLGGFADTRKMGEEHLNKTILCVLLTFASVVIGAVP